MQEEVTQKTIALSMKTGNQFKRAFCGVQITKFSVEEMQENGWNIWMWDKRIIPTGYIIDDGSPDVIDF